MSRFLAFLAAMSIFLVGMAWAFQQEALLFKRVPAEAFGRYAADLLIPPMPHRLKPSTLKALCPESFQRPAQCIADIPKHTPDEATLDEITQKFVARIVSQLDAATMLQTISPGNYPSDSFSAFYQSLQMNSEARLNVFGALWPVSASRESVSHYDRESFDKLKSSIGRQAVNTAAAFEKARNDFATAATPQDRWEAARNLGLVAGGWRVIHDYGVYPPKSILITDRHLLAEPLERLRRAASHASDDSVKRTFSSALKGIALSGFIAILLAIILDKAPILIACVVVLIAASWLMLADIALTGPAALRYLPVIQHAPYNLTLGSLQFPVHLPLICLSFGMLLLKIVWSKQLSWLWKPIDGWVATGSSVQTVCAGLGLLAFATALVMIQGYSASISEVLLALGILGIATYVARHAALASLGGATGWYMMPVLMLGIAAAIAGSMARGDLGNAGVALSLMMLFLLLFLRPYGFTLFLIVLAASGWQLIHYADYSNSPLDQLVSILAQWAPHAAERFLAMKDAFNHGPSDSARLEWLRAISGSDGWGMAYVPWSGLPGSRWVDGLPLQAPSDYTFIVGRALWGDRMWIFITLLTSVFAFAAWSGFRIALGNGFDFRRRFIGAVGGLGCGSVLVKALLSIAGNLKLLPQTGVPVALLSYAPTAMWFALFYLLLIQSISERADP